MAQEFVKRHIGPSQEEIQEMLQVVGAPDLDTLITETVPDAIRMDLTWTSARR